MGQGNILQACVSPGGGSLYDVTLWLAAWSHVPSRGSLSSVCVGGGGSLSGGRPPKTVYEKAVHILLECCLVSDETGLHLPDNVISDKGRGEVNYHH